MLCKTSICHITKSEYNNYSFNTCTQALIYLCKYSFQTLAFSSLLLTNTNALWSTDWLYPGGVWHASHTILSKFSITWLSSFFVYYLFHCLCFISNWIFIWTNTVCTEVAKTDKRANYFAFLFLCSFVFPSATVGKYKERRLADEIELTIPTIIINTNTPVY